MIKMYFSLVLLAIVAVYVSRYITTTRRQQQDRYWREFLVKMTLQGRVFDANYQHLSEQDIEDMDVTRIVNRPMLSNELDACYLNPDCIVRLIGSKAVFEHWTTTEISDL